MIEISTNTKDYIKYYNFIEKETCTDIVNHLETLSWAKHGYYSYINNTNESYEDDLFVNNSDTYYKLMLQDKLWDFIRQYIHSLNMPWFDVWHGYTSLRFNKYETGTKMRMHCDHIHSIFDGEIKGIPTLTVLGFLNDDFEGGELLLCGEKINTVTGSIVIFPSNFMYPHEVKTIISGTRYSFVTWVF